jgi:molybdate transport system substrate-binding protein
MRTQWVATVVLLLFGCGANTEPAAKNETGGKPSEQVIAFVAASTQDAVRDIAAAFTEQGKIEVKVNADDSAKLAMQITQQAPADVFLSANEQWARFVERAGLVQDSAVLLTNSLVLIVPKTNPAGVNQPEDLLQASVQRVALAGPTVPAGIYARQALGRLHLLDKLAADKKVISGDNVRVTLAYVERGEVEAGIVYATDARISDKVKTVYGFDKKTHDAIRYPLLLLKSGRHAAASDFYRFLQGERAKSIFQKHGFALYDGP